MSDKTDTKNIIETQKDFEALCKSMDLQHQLFCDHYLISLNAAESYRKAGYKAKGNSAEASAIRLLRNVKVKKYIDYKIRERKKRLAFDEKYIIEYLKSILNRDITDYYTQNNFGQLVLKDLSTLPKEKRALIEEISETMYGLRIKLVSFQSGIEKLGAHLGMWNKDKQNSNNEGKYIILRYIVPAVGNVMIKPKFTPADAKEVITQHIIKNKGKV